MAQLDLQNSLVDLHLAECLPGPREVGWLGGDSPAVRGQGRGDKGRATRSCVCCRGAWASATDQI